MLPSELSKKMREYHKRIDETDFSINGDEDKIFEILEELRAFLNLHINDEDFYVSIMVGMIKKIDAIDMLTAEADKTKLLKEMEQWMGV